MIQADSLYNNELIRLDVNHLLSFTVVYYSKCTELVRQILPAQDRMIGVKNHLY